MIQIDETVLELSMLFWGYYQKKVKNKYEVLPEVIGRAIDLNTILSIDTNKADFLDVNGKIDPQKTKFKNAKKCAQDCAKFSMDICDTATPSTRVITADIYEEAYRIVATTPMPFFANAEDPPTTTAHGLLCTNMPP